MNDDYIQRSETGVFNNLTDTYPAVLHWNGRTGGARGSGGEMDKWWQKIWGGNK